MTQVNPRFATLNDDAFTALHFRPSSLLGGEGQVCLFICLLFSCLTSQQYASVKRGRFVCLFVCFLVALRPSNMTVNEKREERLNTKNFLFLGCLTSQQHAMSISGPDLLRKLCVLPH